MDITDVILHQHMEQRRMFAVLDEMPRDDTAGLGAVWQRLAILLEVHAEAEEKFFYPPLLHLGTGAADAEGVDDEVEDAVKDHNDIRDAITKAEGQEVGAVVLLDAYPSDQWRDLEEPTEAEALVGVLRLGGVEPPDRPLDRAGTIRLLQESGSAVGRLPEPVLHGCLASVVDAARIVRGSHHRRLAGDLTLVVAGAPRKETWLDPSGWAAHTAGNVTTVTLDATHGDLVRRPVVDQVGTLLTRLVE